MTDDLDIRIKTGFLRHPKTQRLIRIIGERAPQHLIALWCFCRLNRTDGVLSNMDSIMIAIAAEYPGEPEHLVNTLVDEGWLDLADTNGTYRVHDWEEHQGWSSGAGQRQASARYASLVKWHGQDYADAKMPNWKREGKLRPECGRIQKPMRAHTKTDAGAMRTGMRAQCPSPSPSPSPSPTPEEPCVSIELISAIIDDLNQVTGRTEVKNQFKRVESTIQMIRSRIRDDGATLDDFKHVHLVKWLEWKDQKSGTGKPMADFVRPKTLYNRTNFEEYRAQRMPAGATIKDAYGESGKTTV